MIKAKFDPGVTASMLLQLVQSISILLWSNGKIPLGDSNLLDSQEGGLDEENIID